MRLQSFLAMALLPVAACGGGGGEGSPDDASVIDAPPGTPAIDAKPGETPDAASLPACSPVVNGTTIALQNVAAVTDDDMPVLVTSPKNDPRLFVVTRDGKIRILENGEGRDPAFLDIESIIVASGGTGEAGLLGLAFHPNYATNRKFYVYYTARGLESDDEAFRDVVAEYQASATDPNVAEPDGKELLTIPDPASNHNGGMIEFGPDGRLWIGTGDGGQQGREGGLIAQDDSRLLGKILRLNVDQEGARPEIWAKGLRNPWRWSFDTKTNDLYLGDVGFGAWEEIDVVPTTTAGIDFGWGDFEGDVDGPIPGTVSRAGKTFPVTVKPNGTGGWKAIIGGQVYRGTCFPDIDGWYFYSDFSKRELWTFEYANGEARNDRKVMDLARSPTSIHASANGELYIAFDNGQISRIVAGP